MKCIKQILALLLSLAAVIMLLPSNVLAAGSIDLNREVSLTISYQDKEKATPLIGAKFNIYLVATVDEYGELTVAEAFKQFNIDIRGKDDEAWKQLASTIEGYVLRDKIAAADSGITDSEGKVSFPASGKKLTPGLYMVLGERHTQDQYRYDASPFMVMLPGQDQEVNEWVYDITSNAKFESERIPDEPVTITRKVLKVWKDTGHEKERPKEVIIQLLGDGEVYDTVTLNVDNNWGYTWSGLDDGREWTIVEKELEGYTVAVAQEGVTFVVTNTYVEKTPSSNTSSTPTNSGKTNLPQTGQLWWPVPVLVCAGLLLIVVGLIRRGAGR